MVLARIGSTAAATLLFALTGAAAQQKIAFDPARDLSGFEERRFSAEKDLYPLDRYSDMLGKELDARQLEEIRERWKADCAEVQGHLDQLRTDPPAGLRWVIETRMARHKFFSKLSFAADSSVPPFLVFVQKPSFEDPDYSATIVQLLAPYLKKLGTTFEARVAGPSGAQRDPKRPLTPIVVLASPGDFENYYRLGGIHNTLTRGAEYDEKLDLVLVMVNSFEKPKLTPTQAHALLRESFLSMLRAHSNSPAGTIDSMWLREGLAGAFTWPRGAKPESLDEPEPRVDDLRLLVETCHNPAARKWYLRPVAWLSAITTWDDLWSRATQDGWAEGFSSKKLGDVFMAESALWMQFLTTARSGAYGDRLRGYVKTALGGASNADVFALAFADVRLTDLDKEFWAWVYDEHVRRVPNVAVDRNDLVGLFAPPPKAEEPVDSAAVPSGSGVEPVEPPFDPATLSLGEEDFVFQHALALRLVLGGDFETARARLEALSMRKPPAPEDGRIQRDLQRLKAAISLRGGFLQGLVARGGRLVVEIDGKKVNAPVVGVQGGVITFGENSFGATSLPVTALGPAELARQTEKKELQADAPPWTRPWLLLLAGDPKWDRLLKTDSPEAKDLKLDATTWYRDRLQAGVDAQILEGLSKQAVPSTRAEAEGVLAGIRRLMSPTPSLCVVVRKDRLARLAREALRIVAEGSEPAAFVHGKLTSNSDGTVTLAYEFDSAAETTDLVIDAGHLAEWRKSFPSGTVPESKSVIELRDGHAEMSGNALWRLPLGFESPLSAVLEYTYRSADGRVVLPPNVGLLLCDDGKNSFVGIDSWGGILVNDAVSGGRGHSQSKTTTYFPDKKYVLDITHDGKRISTTLDGDGAAQCDSGALVAGGVELLVISEGVLDVHRLEISGKLDPRCLAGARSAWVRRSLVEMGF